MAQGWFERILLYFTNEVIAASTEVSRAEDCTRRDFPFQVEVVLHRVWELWVVSRLNNVKRLLQGITLGVEKIWKHIGIDAKKGRQKTIDTKQDYRELIAKDADTASQYGLGVTEDAPGKAGLG